MRNFAKKITTLCTFIWAMGLASASQGASLIVGIAPSIPEPTPTFVEIKADSKKKRFQKAHYRKIPPAQSKKEAWQAVIDYLKAETKLNLALEEASSQLDFELKLAKGYFDFAYVTPTQFAAFNPHPGYKAVAKRKAQPLRGIVVAKKGGAITTLRLLEEKVIVFPGLLDFPGSIVPRQSLSELNFPIKPQFVASQARVYESVIDGRYLAGAGTNESFETLPPETRNQLHIIWDTPGYTPYAFAAHPRVPFFSIIKMQRAMVGMTKTEQGKKLLPYIFVKNGFETAKDADWHDAKNIDLHTLNNVSNSQPSHQNEN